MPCNVFYFYPQVVLVLMLLVVLHQAFLHLASDLMVHLTSVQMAMQAPMVLLGTVALEDLVALIILFQCLDLVLQVEVQEAHQD